ncbi:SDR family NAD(P)-dependent oxidoreductase [Micromonospora sp. C28SCA-DRY-2]|uniref:SDR family NAD(P)-dependent oxidoreductase n=1 Tax=Micromonospora sp. C28SCA-DRY-2 TaxID=3059522 RepID=UPI002676B0BA|nr:SDR family NAD(P)-dependent oxidoreductase [Micromonospora sp. C28SCA-DRY-2]MDO3705302.1 SDR family NAD(P)-dependent oxidoreductase [Micromonospora sp. C28SCA-DRY-2]
MSTPTTGRPLAVVTGASSGIGYELAVQFVEHGFDVVVAAEDEGIGTAAQRLRRDNGPRVQPVRVDLARPEGVEELVAAVRATGRAVDALALNAGRGAGGEFVGGTELADELTVVDLNVRSTVHLAKLLLPGMVERGAGRVLFTSSIAATMPGPFQAVYNASKSFVQSFAEALRNELKDTGVTVTSLMPGPTDTEFFDRADMRDTRVGSGRKDDPRRVAEQGFAALMRGDQTVTAGSLLNKVQTAAGKIVPDKLKSAQHRRMAEPGSGG